MTLWWPDVSNRQWGLPWTVESQQALINFLSGLHTEGFAGVCHKVSEGDDFQDPYWQACRTWCEQNDLSWLGYHYATTDDPASQVGLFVDNNGGPNVMIDVEANSGNINNFWALVNAFNNVGVNVSLAYIPRWYWGNIAEPDLSALPANQISLVSSGYPVGDGGYAADIYTAAGGDGGEGWAPYGGATPAGWQFSDSANVGGLFVDCNAYTGSNLDALFTGAIFSKEEKL